MKKMYRFLFAVAAAATALVGCVREPEMLPTAEEHPIHFVAESISTRTAFGDPTGNLYPTLWTANDTKVKIMNNMYTGHSKDADVTPSSDGKTASFSATIKDTTTYTFYAASPAAAVLNFADSAKVNNVNQLVYRLGVNVPATQTPGAKSVDEAAQILVARSSTMTELPETVPLHFKHWTAYGKLSFSNLALNGATIQSVELTAEIDWVGRWYYYFSDESSLVNGTSGSKTISVNTTSASDIWFACAPVDLSGKTLTAVVHTDNGTLRKEFTMPANSKFISGQIARFTLNMNGATSGDPVVYTLVTKESDLVLGSKIIIAAAADDDKQAISTTQNTNNRAAAVVNKADGKITDPGESVEIFTLVEGFVENTFAFEIPVPAGAPSTEKPKYIYAGGGSSNKLLTKTQLDAKGSWSLTFGENGAVTARAQIEGETARAYMRYNPNNGSPIFSCYASSSPDGTPVSIYQLVGDTPVEKKDCGLWLEETSYTIDVGESVEIAIKTSNLDPGYFPDGGTITYSLDDETVAKFDEDEPNTIIGLKGGSCIVTVTASETEHFKPATKTCAITVRSNEAKTLPYEEPLTSTLGDFTIQDKTLPEGLSYVWGDKPNGYAKGNAYVSSTYYKAESWLVSPQIDATAASQVAVSFNYVLNYGDPSCYADQFYLQVYDGTSWTKVNIPGLPITKTWDWHDAVVDLTAYAGKTIQVAFVYNSLTLTGAAPTIEIKNFKINTVADCKISVAENLSMMVGDDPVNLSATVNSGATLSYVSADPSVATVTSAGLVTAVAAGTTTITVSAPANGLYAAGTAIVNVTISDSSTPIYYTLDGTVTGGDNGYATESSITQNGISWKITGNTTMSPWRIGGKNLSGVDRPVYSVTAMSKDITKVVVSHGSMSSITVNSVKLIVSQNANFSNPIDTLTGPAAAADSDMTFTRPSGHSWNNCYFKIVYNLTVSGSANKFIELKAVNFYQK